MNHSVSATGLAAATLLAAAVVTTSAHAGDPEAGKQKSATCVACHAADGNSTIPLNPKLNGQYADYLEQALRQYRAGTRENAVMGGMAAGLSDKDIEDLAAYFSSQSGLGILPDGPNE